MNLDSVINFAHFLLTVKKSIVEVRLKANSTPDFTKLLTAARILPEWPSIIFGSLSGIGKSEAIWRNVGTLENQRVV